MNLSERKAELETMKSSGQISQQGFDALVNIAQSQTPESVEQSAEIPRQDNSIKAQVEPEKPSLTFSPKKGLIIFVALAILVLAFKSTQQSDPKDSQEYKELIQQKTELLAKKAELESKTGDVDELQDDIDGYGSIVENLERLISDVNSLGITE